MNKKKLIFLTNYNRCAFEEDKVIESPYMHSMSTCMFTYVFIHMKYINSYIRYVNKKKVEISNL